MANLFIIPDKELLIEAFSDKLSFDMQAEPLAIEILQQTIRKLEVKTNNDN
jgi:hypothetical protein